MFVDSVIMYKETLEQKTGRGLYSRRSGLWHGSYKWWKLGPVYIDVLLNNYLMRGCT